MPVWQRRFAKMSAVYLHQFLIDGKPGRCRFEAIGVNYPPLHPFCRCTTIPYFADLGGERAAKAEDGSSYTVPGDMSYKDWRKGLQKQSKNGILNINIDEFVPCLKDTKTEAILETEVKAITSPKVLSQCRESNGWYIDWAEVPRDVEIHGLYLKDDEVLQGLNGLKNDKAAKAVYLHWAVAAPHNNPLLTNEKQYTGVGGHLFAICAERSMELGYGGFMYGKAANSDLLKHYIKTFGAKASPVHGHPYGLIIDEKAAGNLLEEYTFERRQQND